MLRKLRLIGAVVGCLILPVQTHAGSDVPRVANTSITAAQIPVASTSIAVSAARFTPIPVVSTFIPVTQHGGRGGSRVASYIRQAAKGDMFAQIWDHTPMMRDG